MHKSSQEQETVPGADGPATKRNDGGKFRRASTLNTVNKETVELTSKIYDETRPTALVASKKFKKRQGCTMCEGPKEKSSYEEIRDRVEQIVQRAQNEPDDEVRAHLKTIRRSMQAALRMASKPSRAKSILVEVKLLQHLRHPCIVHLVDFFQSTTGYICVMERLDTCLTDYAQLVTADRAHKRQALAKEERDKLPPMAHGLGVGGVRCLARDLVSAIAHLHKHRVVHRDIKPDQILIRYPRRGPNAASSAIDVIDPESCAYVLADLGLATVFRPSDEELNSGEDGSTAYLKGTETNMIAGTPQFWPPEVFMAQIPGQTEVKLTPHGDHPSVFAPVYYAFTHDLWGVGATLFWSLTLSHILEMTDYETNSQEPGPDPRADRKDRKRYRVLGPANAQDPEMLAATWTRIRSSSAWNHRGVLHDLSGETLTGRRRRRRRVQSPKRSLIGPDEEGWAQLAWEDLVNYRDTETEYMLAVGDPDCWFTIALLASVRALDRPTAMEAALMPWIVECPPPPKTALPGKLPGKK